MAAKANSYRMISGPQAVQSLDALAEERRKARQAAWPYVWFAPPPGSEHVKAQGDIPAPANGTVTLVASYQVPDGLNFCLTGIVLNADVGNSWTPGDGSIVFSIDINRPGAGNAQGVFFKDFQNILTPLGSLQYGPWPIIATEQAIFEALSTIRIKVLTGVAINPGAPNIIHGILAGYTFPD